MGAAIPGDGADGPDAARPGAWETGECEAAGCEGCEDGPCDDAPGDGIPDGNGWRGPERIWPGRGADGTGRAGTVPVRKGGCSGALGPPVDSGGRIGAGLLRTGSSATGVEPFSDGAAAAGSPGCAGALFATATGFSSSGVG